MLARRRDRQKDRQTGKHDSTKIRQSQKKGKDRETEKKRLSHQKSEKKYREKMKKNDKKEIIKESDVCRNRFHKSFLAVTCDKLERFTPVGLVVDPLGSIKYYKSSEVSQTVKQSSLTPRGKNYS